MESVCYLADGEALFTGDTLFLSNVGRPDLHADGATICIVTHDPRYAEYADRKIHMYDGRVVDEERLNRLREEEDRRIAEQARRGRPASADLKEH